MKLILLHSNSEGFASLANFEFKIWESSRTQGDICFWGQSDSQSFSWESQKKRKKNRRQLKNRIEVENFSYLDRQQVRQVVRWIGARGRARRRKLAVKRKKKNV